MQTNDDPDITDNGRSRDLLVVHLTETDGEPTIAGPFDFISADNYVCFHKLVEGNYAIIRGQVVKGFNGETTPPPAEPEWDYDEYSAYSDDEAPAIKVSVRWPDGGSESPWARDLGDGYAMMNNSTLYPGYQYGDVFKVEGERAGEVVYRPFPVKVVYMYEDPGDNQKGEDSESYKMRKTLADALEPLRGSIGFFSAGQGYILIREGTTPSEVKAALDPIAVEITDIKVQSFDVTADEYTYLDIE